MKKYTLILLAFLASVSVFGQNPENKKLFLGYYLSNKLEKQKLSLSLEAGTGGFSNPDLNDKWHIRQSVSSGYYNDYYGYYGNYRNTSNIVYNMTLSHFGIKPEWLLVNDKICIGSGLRFTAINNSCLGGTNDDNGYFYLLYNQTSDKSEYAKVKEIEQQTNYLGVPLELSYFPVKYDLINFYLKVGAELAFKVKSATNIRFVNSSMNIYEQEILKETGTDVNSTLALCYSSLGIRIGKTDHVKFNLEVILPSKILTTNNSALFNTTGYLGSGVQVSLQVPVK